MLYWKDSSYYLRRLRTEEWHDRQTVSLLELRGLDPRKRSRRKRLKVLWTSGVHTAQQLVDHPIAELAEKLLAQHEHTSNLEEARDWVIGWKNEIADLWKERGGHERPSGDQELTPE